MAQKKKKFTKQQIAKKVGIQSYMMAAWEQQFEISPTIKNGEATYSRKQLGQFKAIKELLYEKGFSMDAAMKYLKDQTELEGTTLIAASPLFFESHTTANISDQQPSQAELILSQPASLPASHDLEKLKAHQKNLEQQVTSKLLGIKEQLLKLSKSL